MTKMKETDIALMFGLSRLTSYLQNQISLLSSRHGLTQTQFAVLDALFYNGPLLVGEIQRIILSTPGNVPFVINNLIKKGLVERCSLESDKRCSKVSLTVAGRKKIMEILPCHDEILTEKFSVLEADEKQKLLLLVERFRNRLKEEDEQER